MFLTFFHDIFIIEKEKKNNANVASVTTKFIQKSTISYFACWDIIFFKIYLFLAASGLISCSTQDLR